MALAITAAIVAVAAIPILCVFLKRKKGEALYCRHCLSRIIQTHEEIAS